jgi:uncharacterized protein (DUF488 family)
MILFTIGHSTKTLEEFLQLLKLYEIKRVVDVRRFPQSKRFPHFNRTNLEQIIPAQGMMYSWSGDTLGGFRKEGYQEHMKSEEFTKGINLLLSLAEREQTVIMCSEKDWTRCHRKEIAEYLTKQGHQVIHIVSETQIYEHPLRDSQTSGRSQTLDRYF